MRVYLEAVEAYRDLMTAETQDIRAPTRALASAWGSRAMREPVRAACCFPSMRTLAAL